LESCRDDRAAHRRANEGLAALLVVLDEAANIAPLRDLDTVASTAAGQGIQLVSVFQDLAQVSARFGERAATVVNNHSAKVLLSGISDPATLEYAARLLGDEEVMHASVTRGEHGEHSTTESTGYRNLAPGARTKRSQARRGGACIWAPATGPGVASSELSDDSSLFAP
jgi:type IV secretory pathway TraG/TraD family ATPase VirD4